MKALFVGLGSIGQRHLRNLRRLVPDIDVMAVRSSRSTPILSDSNEVIPETTLAKDFKISEFDSLKHALDARPDLVFITNPSNMHLKVASEALAAGAFVFIEKPLSHSWEGVEDLRTAECASGKKHIAMGFQLRFHPAMRIVSKLLGDEHIGRLVGVELAWGEYLPGWHPYENYQTSYAARRDLGGGAILSLIHHFDNALWLVGRPNRVFALGGQLSSLGIDVEDSVKVLMAHGCGRDCLPVSISLDYLRSPAHNSLSFVGDDGTISCDIINAIVSVSKHKAETVKFYEFPNFERNQMFLDELRNFLDFAAGKAEPAACLSDGIDSLRLALATRQSLESGNVVPLMWSQDAF